MGFAVWQLVGLLPVLTWLANPAAVTANMWAAVVAKLMLALIGLGVFFGAKRLINFLHRRKHGVNDPAMEGATYDPAEHRPAVPPPVDLWPKK